ncbi:Protein TIFY 3B [Linum grandiflorum]
MESETGKSSMEQVVDKKVIAVKKEQSAEDEGKLEIVGGAADLKSGSDSTAALPSSNSSRDEALAKSVVDTEPEQLTIFYGGSVIVLDGIPADKAREIMAIAAAAAKAVKSTDIKKIETAPVLPATPPPPAAATPTLSRSATMQSTTATGLASEQYAAHKNSLCKMQAELPIARRHSLQRFFEKRRDRMMTKSPYSVPSSPSSAAKLEENHKMAAAAAAAAPNQMV